MKKLLNNTHLLGLMLNIGTIVIVAIMLLVSQVFAEPSQTRSIQSIASQVLSYQGTLMDSSGNPVTGSIDITFRIYNSPTEPASLWEETRSAVNAVPVENGLFHVMLGSLDPIPVSIWDETNLYLGITVGNDTEMTPRESITRVAYADQAGFAQSVPAGSLNSTHVNLTSGSVKANADLVLTSTNQVVPGMEASITLETPQTLYVFYTIYLTSSATSQYGTAYVRVIGEGETYNGPIIVASWPTTDTYSIANSFDLPAGTYTIQALAKSYSGEATVRSAWTNMNWFAFSQ